MADEEDIVEVSLEVSLEDDLSFEEHCEKCIAELGEIVFSNING